MNADSQEGLQDGLVSLSRSPTGEDARCRSRHARQNTASVDLV